MEKIINLKMIKDLNIDRNKEELVQKGYSILENRLSPEILKSAREAYNKIYQSSINGDYNYVRVYDDYSNTKNIAGIESPFNKKILSQEIIDFIEDSKIIEIAQNIIQDEVVLELSRYHLTNKFSHIGIWHRDEDVHQTKYETLQLNIHLFDEMGVQVIDGSHQSRDEDVDFLLKKNPYSTLKNSRWLKVSAGDILVFDPSLLHRGISAKPRANMHFRFRKKNNKKYSLQHYDYLDNYKMSDRLKHQILYNLNYVKLPEPYNHPKSIKYNFLRLLRRFIHNFIIFLPLNSKVYSFFLAWPNLTLRKFFKIEI